MHVLLAQKIYHLSLYEIMEPLQNERFRIQKRGRSVVGYWKIDNDIEITMDIEIELEEKQVIISYYSLFTYTSDEFLKLMERIQQAIKHEVKTGKQTRLFYLLDPIFFRSEWTM